MILHIKDILDYTSQQNIACKYYGNQNLSFDGFSSLNNLKANSITWIKNVVNYDISNIDMSLNLLIIAETNDIDKTKLEGYNIITCDNPKELYFSILTYFFKDAPPSKIEITSTILTKKIGNNVTIGHNCYICEDVIIGNNVSIKNNVVIECKTEIGNNTIINSGTVIGTDGFGYYKGKDNRNYKVPHFGGVIIGKDVEIGANTCIDRGTIDDTIIEDNVKIDNLCHIAHNVHIMEKVSIIAMSMLAGSSTLKKNAYIAPGSMIMNQITIGENSLVGMGAVVTKDVEANKVVVGVPAKVIRNV